MCHGNDHDHEQAIIVCCHDRLKMEECCHKHEILMQERCNCHSNHQHYDMHMIFVHTVNSFCAKAHKIKQKDVTDSHYSKTPNLHLIIDGGQYPYSICYMAFRLRQTQTAKFLLHIGGDFGSSMGTELPSYLLEYCRTGKPDYLSWLCGNLPNPKLEMLVQKMIDTFMKSGDITKCYLERTYIAVNRQ